MNDLEVNPADVNNTHIEATSPAETKMSKSMHDGVEVWCDCCSCEAEPYWVEAMQDYNDKLKD